MAGTYNTSSLNTGPGLRLIGGAIGVVAVISNRNSNMNKYQTRVISIANQVNLKFEEATPLLQRELINSIGNIF